MQITQVPPGNTSWIIQIIQITQIIYVHILHTVEISSLSGNRLSVWGAMELTCGISLVTTLEMTTHPLGRLFNLILSTVRKVQTQSDSVHGNVSMSSFQTRRFRCVCLPPPNLSCFWRKSTRKFVSGCVSTLLGVQFRFWDKPLKFHAVCPQNGTAVLKGLILVCCVVPAWYTSTWSIRYGWLKTPTLLL